MKQNWKEVIERIVQREIGAITGDGWLHERLRRPALDLDPLKALVQPTQPVLRYERRWLVVSHVRELLGRAMHGEETRAPTNAELMIYLWEHRRLERDVMNRLLLAQSAHAALTQIAISPPQRIIRFISRWRRRLPGVNVMQRQVDLVRRLRRPERRNPYWRTVLAA